MDTVSFTDGIAKEYINFRKLIKKQTVSNNGIFFLRFHMAKRVYLWLVLLYC